MRSTKPRLARVDLVGGRKPEVHVIAHTSKLASLGLTLSDLVQRLASTNVVVSSGLLEEDHLNYLAEVTSNYTSMDDIGATVVGLGPERTPLFLRDVGRIECGVEPQFSFVTSEGVDAVLLTIRSQPDASTLKVSAGIERELEALRPTLPRESW